jgi:guanylate cyclase
MARQVTACLDLAATGGAVLLIMQHVEMVQAGPFDGNTDLTLQVAAIPVLFLILMVTVTYVRLRFLWSLPLVPAFVVAYVVAALQADVHTTVIAANAVAFGAAAVFGVTLSYLLEAGERGSWFDQLRIEEQRQRADGLLHSILPPQIAQRVHAGEHNIADRHSAATVLFADLVGFTTMAESRPPGEMLAILDSLMRAFDAVADAHGLEKIKTVGDAYMAVAGVPEATPDHADRALAAARDMIRAAVQVSGEIGAPLKVRVGLDSGPLVAGIIGDRKPMYDLWGDTVNTASRMESHGIPGVVQITDSVRDALHDVSNLQERVVEVKGKGSMRTWIWNPSAASAATAAASAAEAAVVDAAVAAATGPSPSQDEDVPTLRLAAALQRARESER